MGLHHLSAQQSGDLYKLIIGRHRRASLVITGNRPLKDWGTVLGDSAVAGSILDRFLRQAEVIRLQGVGTPCILKRYSEAS